MSYAATAQDETEDRYHTQIEEGDVRLFTLDQLDAAFNAGLIHENTYVCLEGDSNWVTLGEVAGLGDEEPVSAPHPVAAPVSYVHAVPNAPAYPPVVSASAYPPVAVAPSLVPATYSVAPMARSIAPVVNDFSFDDDMDMMRPKRKLGKIVAGVVVLGLAGLGIAVATSGGLQLPKLKLDSGVSQASAASLTLSNLKESPAPTPAAAPVTEVAKVEAPKAEEPKAAAASDESASSKKGEDRFSEEMKAALLNKDKKQGETQKTKKAGRVAVAAKQKSGKPSKGSAGFKSSGSAYDPLNGKL